MGIVLTLIGLLIDGFIIGLIIKVLILAIKRLEGTKGGNPRHYGRRRRIRGAK